MRLYDALRQIHDCRILFTDLQVTISIKKREQMETQLKRML